MHLPHLHRRFRVAWGFVFCCRLTHLHMPDEVSVRQVSGLPRASFRFRLATDTLASGYELGATSCSRDFHPLEFAHAGHTTKRPAAGIPVRGPFAPSSSFLLLSRCGQLNVNSCGSRFAGTFGISASRPSRLARLTAAGSISISFNRSARTRFMVHCEKIPVRPIAAQ